MSYVSKIMSQDEKLLCMARPHWIYVFEGFFWLIALTALGLLLEHYLVLYTGYNTSRLKLELGAYKIDYVIRPLPLIFTAVGAALFLTMLAAYISTEVGLTDQRVIHKRGIIFIRVEEADLEEVKAEHIEHGWLGWLLGYGRIRIDCRFVDDILLPAIGDPYHLVKTSHKARMSSPKLDYAHDELRINYELLEERRRKATLKAKLAALKARVKGAFDTAR